MKIVTPPIALSCLIFPLLVWIPPADGTMAEVHESFRVQGEVVSVLGANVKCKHEDCHDDDDDSHPEHDRDNDEDHDQTEDDDHHDLDRTIDHDRDEPDDPEHDRDNDEDHDQTEDDDHHDLHRANQVGPDRAEPDDDERNKVCLTRYGVDRNRTVIDMPQERQARAGQAPPYGELIAFESNATGALELSIVATGGEEPDVKLAGSHSRGSQVYLSEPGHRWAGTVLPGSPTANGPVLRVTGRSVDLVPETAKGPQPKPFLELKQDMAILKRASANSEHHLIVTVIAEGE